MRDQTRARLLLICLAGTVATLNTLVLANVLNEAWSQRGQLIALLFLIYLVFPSWFRKLPKDSLIRKYLDEPFLISKLLSRTLFVLSVLFFAAWFITALVFVFR